MCFTGATDQAGVGARVGLVDSGVRGSWWLTGLGGHANLCCGRFGVSKGKRRVLAAGMWAGE